MTGGEDLNICEEMQLINNAIAGDKKNRKALLLKENNIASMINNLGKNRGMSCVHFALHEAWKAYSGDEN